MISRYHPFLAALVLLLAAPQGWSTPWSTDMRDQPSVKSQEAEVEHNSTSIPADSSEVFRPPRDTIELVRARLAAGAMENPSTPSPESIDRGRALYEVHCQLCHGPAGRGDGMVGQKFVPQPMDLTLDYVQMQPDGQLFYTISYGSIAMPFYRDAIVADDRWHVVNYIKEVLGKK